MSLLFYKEKNFFTLKKHTYFIFPVSLISTFLSVLYLNAHKTTTISEDHFTTQFSSGTKHTIFSDFVVVFQEKKGFLFKLTQYRAPGIICKDRSF